MSPTRARDPAPRNLPSSIRGARRRGRSAGLREDRGFESSARPLRTVPAAPPIEEDDVGLDPGLVVTDEDVVSIDELLVWEGTEEQGPIDTRIGRLASLLGIAAVLIAVLVLVLAARTDVNSLFRSLPGS